MTKKSEDKNTDQNQSKNTKSESSPDSNMSDEQTVNFDELEEFDVSQEPEMQEDETTPESFGSLATSDDEFKSVSQARDQLEQQLLIDPGQVSFSADEDGVSGQSNIVGVGVGEKYVNGLPTNQLAVKVFVKEKLSESDISSEALVPKSLGGVTTDVDEVGDITAQMFTARLRPAPCGVSIGHCPTIHAGTLGCLVIRAGQLFILSNNHVIARVNAGPINVPISQPGRLDIAGSPACNVNTIIARLTQFVPINFSAGICNFVDAAIARTSPNLVDRRILRPSGVRQQLVAPHVAPALNMFVHKSGRTTQYRRGVVDAVDVTVNVSYAPHGGVARFCRQFRVRGTAGIFSDRGDSGSLVTTFPANRPVGLLFAGNAATNTTFCNPIGAVLSAFGVNIVY